MRLVPTDLVDGLSTRVRDERASQHGCLVGRSGGVGLPSSCTDPAPRATVVLRVVRGELAERKKRGPGRFGDRLSFQATDR